MNQRDLHAVNYCACFIDLLGQQDEYKNESLLPTFKSSEEENAFVAKLKATIGITLDLQKSAADMMKAAASKNPAKRDVLNEELREIYDEMRRVEPKQQRWSDGLVFYVSLMMAGAKCPMNGVFVLFALAGSLCFLGLAKRRPLRGAIDVAWGIELHENELYGAIVAKAYELESKVAQYPRIVVGPRTVEYLELNSRITDQDHFSQYNKALAVLCLQMLAQDTDGHYILHYLGDLFRRHISQGQHGVLYKKALELISEEFALHQRNKNSKLAFRYASLLSYFAAHEADTNDTQK